MGYWEYINKTALPVFVLITSLSFNTSVTASGWDWQGIAEDAVKLRTSREGSGLHDVLLDSELSLRETGDLQANRFFLSEGLKDRDPILSPLSQSDRSAVRLAENLLAKPLPREGAMLVNQEALELLLGASCHPADPALRVFCDGLIQDPEELRRIAVDELGHTAQAENALLLFELLTENRIYGEDGSVLLENNTLQLQMAILIALGNLGALVSATLEPEELSTLMDYYDKSLNERVWLYNGSQWYGSYGVYVSTMKRAKERVQLREFPMIYSVDRWYQQKNAWYPQRLKNLVPDMATFVASCLGAGSDDDETAEKCIINVATLGTAPVFRFARDTVHFVLDAAVDAGPSLRTSLSRDDDPETWQKLKKGPRAYADSWFNLGLAITIVGGARATTRGVLRSHRLSAARISNRAGALRVGKFEREAYSFLDSSRPAPFVESGKRGWPTRRAPSRSKNGPFLPTEVGLADWRPPTLGETPVLLKSVPEVTVAPIIKTAPLRIADHAGQRTLETGSLGSPSGRWLPRAISPVDDSDDSKEENLLDKLREIYRRVPENIKALCGSFENWITKGSPLDLEEYTTNGWAVEQGRRPLHELIGLEYLSFREYFPGDLAVSMSISRGFANIKDTLTTYDEQLTRAQKLASMLRNPNQQKGLVAELRKVIVRVTSLRLFIFEAVRILLSAGLFNSDIEDIEDDIIESGFSSAAVEKILMPIKRSSESPQTTEDNFWTLIELIEAESKTTIVDPFGESLKPPVPNPTFDLALMPNLADVFNFTVLPIRWLDVITKHRVLLATLEVLTDDEKVQVLERYKSPLQRTMFVQEFFDGYGSLMGNVTHEVNADWHNMVTELKRVTGIDLLDGTSITSIDVISPGKPAPIDFDELPLDDRIYRANFLELFATEVTPNTDMRIWQVILDYMSVCLNKKYCPYFEEISFGSSVSVRIAPSSEIDPTPVLFFMWSREGVTNETFPNLLGYVDDYISWYEEALRQNEMGEND